MRGKVRIQRRRCSACLSPFEVVVNFKEEGMSMQEKAVKIIKKDGEISVQK